MADLIPVDHDPFAQTAALATKLTPVDHDPFAAQAPAAGMSDADRRRALAEVAPDQYGVAPQLGNIDPAVSKVFTDDASHAFNAIKGTLGRAAHDIVNPSDLVSDVKDIGTGIAGSLASGAKFAVQHPQEVPGKIAGYVEDQFVNHPAQTLANLIAINPVARAGIGAAVSAPADLVGGAAKVPISVASGLTPSAQSLIARDAAMGNTAAVSAMRGNELADPVVMAKNAMSKVAEERQARYAANKAEWGKDSQSLSYQPIQEALDKADLKGKSSSGFVVDPRAQETVKEMRAIVDEHMTTPFQDATPITMDELKQRLGVLREDTTHTSRSRAAVDQVYNAVKDEIVDKAPRYAKAMEGYSNASQQLNELSRSLSLNPNASQGTTLAKLQTMMRNDVSANYGQRAKLGEVLSKYEPNLMPTLAGQMAGSWSARGLVGRMGELGSIAGGVAAGVAAPHLIPAALAGLAVSSPRLVGETINALNRARGPVSALSGGGARIATHSLPMSGLLDAKDANKRRGLLSP